MSREIENNVLQRYRDDANARKDLFERVAQIQEKRLAEKVHLDG